MEADPKRSDVAKQAQATSRRKFWDLLIRESAYGSDTTVMVDESVQANGLGDLPSPPTEDDLPPEPLNIDVPETRYPNPPEQPPTCNVPGAGNSSADPQLVTNLANVFCKTWPAPKKGSPFPAQPDKDISRTLTEADLSPKVDGAKLKVTFDFKKGNDLDGCFMGCTDLFTEMVKSCQFNQHQITGVSVVLQECGTSVLTIDG
ncbi:MAG: hypothetical protein Q9227_007221 [Pyrenula ochraceoflavens]